MKRPFGTDRSLFESLIQAKNQYGSSRVIIEDQDRKPLTYEGFFRGVFALSRLLGRHLDPNNRVGVMLPTSLGGALTFWTLQAMGRVPVMINFTAGSANIRAAIETAGVTTVITSRRFIENAKLDDLAEAMSQYVTLIRLDDIRKEIGIADKLFAVAAARFPSVFAARTRPEDIGVILFTSGSFGAPRGVVLSQANLVANTNQIDEHIHLSPEWRFFNPMPIFHSLGLTGGIVLPLLKGLYSFQYPSPLHVKQIPALLKETRSTLLFSTDTFLNQYARQAEPDDFKSLQLIVCGAEKVREETHKLFNTQFGGVPIVEGYGVTETAPVLALNDPQDNRFGTVGKPLPGIEVRLETIEGIAEGGKLWVRGPNVMSGYLSADDPNVIEAPAEGWHDTGDIVKIETGGHIRILGRVKRFAKIAGEMVSLTAVERLAEEVWPLFRHAVVAVSDDKKGERLILFTDKPEADLTMLTNWARGKGMPAFAIPKKLVGLEALPVLGSGKTDYVTLQKRAEAEG